MASYLKAYDIHGDLISTGIHIEGYDKVGFVTIPNLKPHTKYNSGDFFVTWFDDVKGFETNKVPVPEFITEESTNKEFVFYFNESIVANPKTAYDIAVGNGFTGTESEWVASIKGEKGDRGDRGEKGDMGDGRLLDRQVSYSKTDFLTTGKNIFNIYTIQYNTILSYLTGESSVNTNYVSSDFLPVDSDTKYTQNRQDIIIFYNENKNFISGLPRITATINQSRTFTTPSNAKYIKAVSDMTSYKRYQIEKSESLSDFEPFKYYLNGIVVPIQEKSIVGSKIQDNTLYIESFNFLNRSQNIFNKDTATKGYYVNQTNGNLSVNTSYSASDYIDVSNIQTLTKNNTYVTYAFYDSNYNYIPITTTAVNTVTKPVGAKFFRFTILTSALNTTMLVVGDSLPQQYVPYDIKIPKKYLELPVNDLIQDHYGKNNLKAYTADISKQLNPQASSRAEIAIIGDSWVDGGEVRKGDRLTIPLRDKFIAQGYTDGGIGFVSLANNSVGNGLLSVTLNGTWTHYGYNKTNIDQAKGLDSSMVESSTKGDTIKVDFLEQIDFYEIHTLNTGTYKYNVDGGDWVTVDATQQEVTQIPMSLGKHTINIEIVDGTVTFIGSYAYKGNKGTVVHKIGNSGLRVGHVVSTNRDNYIKQLKRIKANTFCILLGTNDMAGNIPLSNYERDMKELISRIKEAKPFSSIILIAPSGNNITNTLHTIIEYSDTQLSIAKELNLSHLSLYRNLGDYDTTNNNGLMASDGVHPNKNGGYAISNVLFDRLFRI